MKVIYEPKGRAREYSELAVNLYNGCDHGCLYCYAPNFLRKDKKEFKENVTIKKDILQSIKEDLNHLKEKKVKKKVLFCFTCDPYQKDENFNIVTRKALELFREYNMPFQILTKGGLKATRDFDLYSSNDAFATTLTYFDESKSLKVEPNAALPKERIAALREAKKKNIETWVSFEPVLSVREVFKLIDETKEYVDLYKIGKLNGYNINIDWKRFAYEVINKLEKLNKKYYIKKDLEVFLNTK